MAKFVRTMGIEGGERIIDLGGTAAFWSDCPYELNVTVLNLPGQTGAVPKNSRHRIDLIEGDACCVDTVDDASFDIAFSNSVIEHVGASEKQMQFAREARRLGRRYWVQTPSIWFPIEAHTHMPFWWFYPKRMQDWYKARWADKLPAWCDMVKGTTVISRLELQNLLPGSNIWTERVMGIAKSYVAYR